MFTKLATTIHCMQVKLLYYIIPKLWYTRYVGHPKKLERRKQLNESQKSKLVFISSWFQDISCIIHKSKENNYNLQQKQTTKRSPKLSNGISTNNLSMGHLNDHGYENKTHIYAVLETCFGSSKYTEIESDRKSIQSK